MPTPAQNWNDALNRYVSTVHTGGTPEQRTWAWARAAAALDTYLEHEHAKDKAKARRAKAETVELPAVHQFPGRSV